MSGRFFSLIWIRKLRTKRAQRVHECPSAASMRQKQRHSRILTKLLLINRSVTLCVTVQHVGHEMTPMVISWISMRHLEGEELVRLIFKLGYTLAMCPIFLASGYFSALHLAAFLGKSQVLNELCELGATTACRDASGRTPLHYGCCSPDSSQKCVVSYSCAIK